MIRRFTHRRSLDIAAAGSVDHIDDFRFAVGRRLKSSGTRIDAGVEDGDDDTAAIEFRVLLQKSQCADFLLRHDADVRKRRDIGGHCQRYHRSCQ